jgi:hypothetical protein
MTPRRRLVRRRPDKEAAAPTAEARSEPPAHGLLRLQQTAGNRAVAGLIQRQRRGLHLLDEGLTLDPEIEMEMRKRGLMPGLSEESKAPDLFDPKAIEKALKPAPDWTPLPEHAPKEPEPIVPRGKGPETPRKGGAGDVWDAVKGIPMVKKGLDKVEEEAKRRWRKARGK